MKQIGILVFYVNIGNLAAEDVDDHIEQLSNEFKVSKNSDPISKWQILFIPVRNQETHIQVIRNDFSAENELNIYEFEQKLLNLEHDNIIEKFKEDILQLQSKIQILESELNKKTSFLNLNKWL